jgi:threonine/homoserine/homoserine lactone efflux protein
MNWATLAFLWQTIIISASGVMSPGPVTAATLAAGTRRRHAGIWIAVGHGVVEFPLMGLIMLGAGSLLTSRSFSVSVGLAGGAVLIMMAVMLLQGLRRPVSAEAPIEVRSPLWTGIALTGGNPYFLLWWATVGLSLASRAAELGMLAFAFFAIVHWLCDVIWLEMLSLASHSGRGVMGHRTQILIQIICALAMAGFGAWFVIDAIRFLPQLLSHPE